jgi:cystathionine gamma-synthase
MHLLTTPKVKQVNYPKTSPTRPNYEKCRNPKGNYGGLLSATFYAREDAVAFFDNLDTVKGPSLGTNFTLSSPYVILAHYGELDWVSQINMIMGVITEC